MGKRSESTTPVTPPPNQLHPRPRQVTFWLPTESGVRPWVFTTEPDTYLVMTPELALQCEVAGVPYTLVNPAHALAVDVSDHVPGEPLRMPTPLVATNGVAHPEEVAEASGSPQMTIVTEGTG